MNIRMVTIVTACLVALVAALPAAAKTPPPSVVARVGIEVAKLGLASGRVDTAVAKCTSKPCVTKSFDAYYKQAHVLDGALEALWSAAGKSGPCASAAANAGAGFDSLTADYHSFEAATLKGNKAAAKRAYGRIQAKVPRLTAVLNSFKTTCR
jgi:hypothetical protein